MFLFIARRVLHLWLTKVESQIEKGWFDRTLSQQIDCIRYLLETISR
jgi:hypothetical protein